jgi:hypothetical protein
MTATRRDSVSSSRRGTSRAHGGQSRGSRADYGGARPRERREPANPGRKPGVAVRYGSYRGPGVAAGQ